MAFKQLLICKNERRLENPLSAFICVHLRLKNIRNNLYYPNLPAPICGIKTLHSCNLWSKSISMIDDYAHRFVQYISAFICGLKFNKPRQPNFIKKLKNQSLLFVKQISVFFFVNLPLINHYILFYTDAEKEGLYPKKDGAAVG